MNRSNDVWRGLAGLGAAALRRLREVPLFGWFVCKRYWHDHCFQSAAAMSYNFLFAAIPMIAVGLAILAAFPVFDQIRLGFQDFIVRYLLPQAGEDFRLAIDEFLRNTRNLTAFGIVALAITAIILLDTIETVFNRIWRQSQVRPLMARVTMYWAILTLTPLLVGGSVALSAFVFDQGGIGRFGFGHGFAVLVWLAPFGLMAAAFMISYIIIPYRRVRLRNALAGALVGGLLFQGLRWGFAVYIEAFPSYRTLYGTLSVIPIFLLWVYLVWCVALFGAEVVAALPEWRRRPGAGTAHGSQPARRLIAARLMLERLFAARTTGMPVGTDALADIAAEALADSDRGAVQAILDRLAEDKIIGRAVGLSWYLAREPRGVKLSALLKGLDLGLDAGEDLAFIRTAWRSRLAGVLAGAGAAEREALEMDLETLFAPVGPVAAAGAPGPKRKAAG
ncbi:MAG: YihY family inner membrane protein [Rhodospirillaceae bacterium]|nr:YihY family inner membrane protein [Rhodospirillaceae bacterium]